jgi:hypothetical protein
MTNGSVARNRRRPRFRLASEFIAMSRRSDDNEPDFAARAVELKAMAEEHRLRAETAIDEVWRTIRCGSISRSRRVGRSFSPRVVLIDCLVVNCLPSLNRIIHGEVLDRGVLRTFWRIL